MNLAADSTTSHNSVTFIDYESFNYVFVVFFLIGGRGERVKDSIQEFSRCSKIYRCFLLHYYSIYIYVLSYVFS